MIRATLSNRQGPDLPPVSIEFPIANYAETYQKLEAIKIGHIAIRDCFVKELTGDYPVLKRLQETEINVDELDYLAKRLESFDRYCHTFEGALDGESINGLDDITAIGEHLDRYLYIPHVTNDCELGLCLVNHGVKPFDESILPYLDYSKVGIEYYSNHGGAYTARGYIVRRDSVEQALVDTVDSRENQQMGGMNMG